MPQKTAYVTGGASGIGLAVTEMLVSRGMRVAIADRNLEGAKSVAGQHRGSVTAYELDAASWDSQASVFQSVVQDLGGRVDYVYPIAGIGERKSIVNDPKATGFAKPDLSVLDVDLNGFVYTASLAIQQMRRQGKDEQGFRGKSTFPIYCESKMVC